MIEKLPVGRSLRSEFSLVHGEIAEPDAAAPSNNFEFGSARQEFSSRRIQDGRGGTLSYAYATDAKASESKRERDRDTVRQVAAIQQAQLLAVGLKGEAFDKHVVTLADGSRMALGDMRRALDVVNRDFDAHVDAAIERGDLPEISQARRDELRGASMETQAALDHGWRTGEGVDQRLISEMQPELVSMLRNNPAFAIQQDASPQAPSVTSAPAMGL